MIYFVEKSLAFFYFLFVVFFNGIFIFSFFSISNPIFFSGLFFISAGARMIPANTLVSAAANSSHRGSFMSILGCVQSISMAFGSWFSGMIITKNPTNGHLEHYEIVGYVSIAVGLLSLYFIHQIKHLDHQRRSS